MLIMMNHLRNQPIKKMLFLKCVIITLVLASIKPPSKLKPVTLSYLLFSTTSEHYWVVLCLHYCKTFDFNTDTKIKHKRNTYTTGKTLGKTTLASAKYS